MKLVEILREVFSREGSKYREQMTSLQENEQRLNRCLRILEEDTARDVREATEEAARFGGS